MKGTFDRKSTPLWRCHINNDYFQSSMLSHKMYVCMYVCMDEWMYICMFLHLHLYVWFSGQAKQCVHIPLLLKPPFVYWKYEAPLSFSLSLYLPLSLHLSSHLMLHSFFVLDHSSRSTYQIGCLWVSSRWEWRIRPWREWWGIWGGSGFR